MTNGNRGPGQPPGVPQAPVGAPEHGAGQSASQQPGNAPPLSSPGVSPGGKAKRRVRNFLLQPVLQVRIGLYSIILSIAFAIALAAIIYFNFFDLVESIVAMTDAEDEVRDIFRSYWRGAQIYIYLAFFVYLAATIGASVLFTHKLVGPTIAFRRHIRSIADGRYNVRTYLRKGDAFLEVADELNHLSEVMQRAAISGAPHPGSVRAAEDEQASFKSPTGG